MGSSSRLAILILSIYIFSINFANANESNQCVSIVDDVKRLSCYDSLFIDRLIEPKLIELEPKEKPVANIKKKDSERTDALMIAAQDAYDQIIEDSKEMTITRIVKNKNKKVYFFTDNERIFRKNTTRVSIFKINDSVELEGGALGAQFLTNQNGIRIKVKEIKPDK